MPIIVTFCEVGQKVTSVSQIGNILVDISNLLGRQYNVDFDPETDVQRWLKWIIWSLL